MDKKFIFLRNIMVNNGLKYASWIHECINLVRVRRSAFSDLDRICRIMLKCHGVSHSDTVSDLEIMVQQGVVSRRAFKGVISYRNVSGKGQSHVPGRSSRVGRWIHEALKELDSGQGVGMMEIEKWVMTSHPYYHNLKGKIKGALKEDLDLGKIWQISEGKYRLLEAAESPERKILDRSLVCDFCLQTAESNRKGEHEDLLICRDCGNRAHPSCMDYSVELTARIRADGGSWQCIDCKACVMCQDSGDPSSLLFCDACDKGYHMQCHTPKLQSMPTGKWACFNCVSTLSHEEVMASIQAPSTFIPTKLCSPVKEQEESNIEALSCDEVMIETDTDTCLKVPDVMMENVDEEASDLLTKINDEEMSTTEDIVTDSSPAKFEAEQSNIVSSTAGIAGVVEDVKNEKVSTPAPEAIASKPKNAFSWNKADVVEYIRSLGFSKEAMVFDEQDIDGPSLMLMSRTDLVKSLHFKLGPALKIYANIAKLQAQSLPPE
ncbi:histone acetyltransferase KAT6A-like [Xenia sp. Carnegie-2017]|uniref:histone acetyltransferase KAT6A-like n=1 Tax=Xenia sp. Carnegie-2017 TaxID=2897299 RepID=UPI001F04BA8D|nr:histone acetyltransferase KAT6A-like [Xenia sp. Carnegie-2017]